MPNPPLTRSLATPDGTTTERFRSVFEDAPVAYHEIDANGIILRVNAAECRLLGFVATELAGRHIWEFVTPAERETCRESIRKTISGESPLEPVEREFVARDGTARVVEVHPKVLRDGAGLIVGIRCALLDITERKRAENALRESEARYRELFENANDVVFTIDLKGNFTDLNKAGQRVTGYSREEALRANIAHLMKPEQAALAQSMIERKLLKSGPTRYELQIFAKDKRRLTLDVSTRLICRDSKPVGIQGIARDITERKQAEDARRESEERYALAVQGANDGLWDWDLQGGAIYFSQRWKAMLGYEDDEIGDSVEEWFSRVHPEDLGRLKIDIGIHLEGQSDHFEAEHRVQHKDGSYRWMLSRGLAVLDAEKKALRMAGSQTDITTRKMAEQRLLHDAFHDELTGLANRALFMERLERVIVRTKRRQNYLFAVMFLDLDRFKVVNDSLGHMVGDQLLVEIARRLEQCLRPEDTVARLGGDEFVMLCDDLNSANDATRVAERILRELTKPFQLDGHEVFTSASIGIALSSTGYQQPEDLLRDADTVMYRAKALGKARYEVYRKGMHSRALARLCLETDLRIAQQRGELVVHYQPIVARESGEIRTVEALARWQHPYRGLIPSEEFVSIAEETGAILAIGEAVLRTACAQNKAWQEAGLAPVRVAVNVSARQFRHPSIIETVSQVLKETDLDPRYLELELTESIVLKDVQATIETLRQLCSMGVRISINDFGTGYCSLKYLLQFPISTLKIDRSFINDIEIDRSSAAIARAVIGLGHSLKLAVVAEGVETEEQLALLELHGCDHIQGCVFSPAVPADGMGALLARRCLTPRTAPVAGVASALATARTQA